MSRVGPDAAGKVLRPVPKAVVHNACVLPVRVAAGLKPGLLRDVQKRTKPAHRLQEEKMNIALS